MPWVSGFHIISCDSIRKKDMMRFGSLAPFLIVKETTQFAGSSIKIRKIPVKCANKQQQTLGFGSKLFVRSFVPSCRRYGL